MAVKRIAVLGSTGSIGVNTLNVVVGHPDKFRIVALAAGSNAAVMIIQARAMRPRVVAMSDPRAAVTVREALEGSGITVLAGEAGVVLAATLEDCDLVVAAIVGAAGLVPTLAAVRAGKDLALANKECLVMAGSLFMREVARNQVRLLPVDSEPSAIFQVWNNPGQLRRIILTASGGPFRGWERSRLAGVTPEQALAHPRWAMGRKISIDSATCMNKGLEVIEASWIFGVAPERIAVVVHPESIVHSLIEFTDGSVLAQLGQPDMRTPIAVALSWPERVATGVARLDLAALGGLTFHAPPDPDAFPCLQLAYQALTAGGAAPIILNAANEVAVEAFLAGRIGFLRIPELVATVLERVAVPVPDELEAIMRVDAQARAVAVAVLDAE